MRVRVRCASYLHQVNQGRAIQKPIIDIGVIPVATPAAMRSARTTWVLIIWKWETRLAIVQWLDSIENAKKKAAVAASQDKLAGNYR